MPEPVDQKLYDKIKSEVIAAQPINSAYRSMRIVTTYSKEFKKKYPTKNPFKGENTRKKGLRRWIDEEWINVDVYMKTGKRIPCGTTAETGKYSACRPWKKITKETPKTLRGLLKDNKQKIKKNIMTKRKVRYTKNVKW